MTFPRIFEPLVTDAPPSRQSRRKAQRAQARSKGHAPAPQPDTAPLPRNRSLARQPTGLIARAAAWLSRIMPRKVASPPAVSQEAMAEQMVALRSELAMVQGRLDRMIAAVSRR